MKVLVTGATGFIGSALVDRLQGKGHELICLIRDENKRDENKKSKINSNTECIVADITDRDRTIQSLRNIDVDVLFHLAAINPLEKDKKIQKKVNIEGMRNIIEACKNKVRLFVYAQGTGVFGNTKDNWIDETTRKKPDTDFSDTRFEAEEMLWKANKQNGMPVTVAILGDVYGAGGWFANHIVNKIRDGSFKIPGSGEYYRSFVHIDDVTNALLLIGEKSAKNSTFLIADNEPVPFAEFVYYVADRLGLKKPGKVPAFLAKAVLGSDMVTLLTTSVKVRNEKVKNELGLQLQYPTYREGVEDALQRL